MIQNGRDNVIRRECDRIIFAAPHPIKVMRREKDTIGRKEKAKLAAFQNDNLYQKILIQFYGATTFTITTICIMTLTITMQNASLII